MHVEPARCPFGGVPPRCSCVLSGCRCMVRGPPGASSPAPSTAAAPTCHGRIDRCATPVVVGRGCNSDSGKGTEVLPHQVCVVLCDCGQEGLVCKVHVLAHADGAIACLSDLHVCGMWSAWLSRTKWPSPSEALNPAVPARISDILCFTYCSYHRQWCREPRCGQGVPTP